MLKIKLNYLHIYKDRHDKQRCYYRPPNGKKITLRARPIGSLEWQQQYHAAVNGQPLPGVIGVGAERSPAGSVNAVIADILASPWWQKLAKKSKNNYQTAFNFLREKIGDHEVALIRRRQIKELLGQKAETYGAYNSLLAMIRKVFSEALDNELRDDDPTIKLKKLTSENPFGHRCWTLASIRQYRDRHPVGTMARLAFACRRQIFFECAEENSEVRHHRHAVDPR